MRHFDPSGVLPFLKDVVFVLVPPAAGAWAWFKTPSRPFVAFRTGKENEHSTAISQQED
jgi:hypothetical protein